ncbi:MAG: hypothetical protein K0Q83_1122, partial [Deltaproteobacteria bacterium]|nr:hypothetical protein [Deltaproteobacteria bacterium]
MLRGIIISKALLVANDFLLQLPIIEQRFVVSLFEVEQLTFDRIECPQLLLAIGQLSLKCLEIIFELDAGLGKGTL